jgi:hypothetical protein
MGFVKNREWRAVGVSKKNREDFELNKEEGLGLIEDDMLMREKLVGFVQGIE